MATGGGPLTASTNASGGLPSITLVPGWLTTAAHWTGQHGLLASLSEHVVYTVVAVGIAVVSGPDAGIIG